MIFEVRPDQVVALSSEQLVSLMKRLLLAECRQVGIPLRAASVPLQITIADGGEDGRATWEGGPDATNYFPARCSIFQAKAQNLTDGSIEHEVVKIIGSAKPALNAAVAEAIARRGAYVIFCSNAFTGQKIERLKRAIHASIRKCKSPGPRGFKCDVYDANKIADWANSHPAVALWLNELGSGRSYPGFHSQDSWARSADFSLVPWVTSSDTRYAPVGEKFTQAASGSRPFSGWTFGQAADEAHRIVSKDGGAVRVAGPSGFGKTRFVFEVFNQRNALADAAESATLVYANYRVVGNEAIKLAIEMASSGVPSILIADECPDEVHMELSNAARSQGSRLRVLSIDVDTLIAPDDDTLVLNLERASDATISAIARAITPSLDDAEARYIEQFSDGFPRMAVLAAPANKAGKDLIRSSAELLGRIVWGRDVPDRESQIALEVASLFDWLGAEGSVIGEAALAASLAEMTRDSFIDRVRSFESRGVVVMSGDYIQIGPLPIAAKLASTRLSRLTQQRLSEFWTSSTERMQKAMLNRMRWLDGSPTAREFAVRLLAPAVLGNQAQLSTDFGADCIDRISHVNPSATLDTLERVLGPLDAVGIAAIGPGRRHLIWTLERLAFSRQDFARAATLLRRFAAVETETQIANNATGQYVQLFQLYLAGTEAALRERLLVLDEGLCSNDPAERSVSVDALERMLGTFHFTRSGGAEEIGSQEPRQDWQPRSDKEAQDFILAGLARLVKVAEENSALGIKARNALGSNVRGLLSNVPLSEIKSMISRVSRSVGVWIEAVQGVNSWLYFDRSEVPSELAHEVREFYDALLPTDEVALAQLFAASWASDLHDPNQTYDPKNNDFDYVDKSLQRLAEDIAGSPELVERAVQVFCCTATKSGFSFARRLAETHGTPAKLFDRALIHATVSTSPPNPQFFTGLISGIEARSPSAGRKCVREALRSKVLKEYAINLIGAGRLNADDIELVASLVDSEDVAPSLCVPLSWGQSMAHLSPEAIRPLIDSLFKQRGPGIWAALAIIFMYLHGGKKVDRTLGRSALKGLLSKNLLKGDSSAIDAHHFESMVKALVKAGRIDKTEVKGS